MKKNLLVLTGILLPVIVIISGIFVFFGPDSSSPEEMSGSISNSYKIMDDTILINLPQEGESGEEERLNE